MAESGGHWKTLAEAQKLTQSSKIPGVFEEDVKRNPILDRMPVVQASGTGTKIEWLREKAVNEDDAAPFGIGDELAFSESQEYTEKETTLARIYVLRSLDHFVEKIYGTYNNYRAQELLECEKILKRKINDKLIYADLTYGGSPAEWDGMHALAAELGTPNSDTVRGTGLNADLNFDQEDEALSLWSLRTVLDAMKLGCDEILIPPVLGVRFDAAYEEKGFVGLATGTAGSLAMLTRGYNELGKPILFYAGVPLTRTDYSVAEDDDTGTGASSDKRGKYVSGDKAYSIFLVKYGDVMQKEPGICFGYGNTEGQGDLYKLDTWDSMITRDASVLRLITYGAVLLGSSLGMGRIFDVRDLAILV